jgi:octanoyl-[GcvH]:protein N-octanoyltransferase
MQVLRRSWPGRAAFDTAVSAALLRRVASGEIPSTFRIFAPDRIVAFGRQDRVRPGYPAAVGAARDAGFEAVERLAGGRAAVFHEATLSFSWALPDPAPQESIHARFAEIAGVIAEALRSLGVDARVGEVPGEYCPGEYSVNAGGARKLMGVGQRLVRGAAHVGGVIVVSRPDLVNLPLVPAYRHLDYAWDPRATGAVADEAPGLTTAEVTAAVLEALGRRHQLSDGAIDAATLDLAERLAPQHAPVA